MSFPSGAAVMCDAQPLTETWHAARQLGIGSSDAPPVLGVSPWRTQTQVYIDKVEGLPVEDNERMYWGRVLEDVVAVEFGVRTGAAVHPCPGILSHPDRKWQLAQPDRDLTEADGTPSLLECKTTDSRNADQWDDGNVPEAYLIQVHHQLSVTGYDHGWIACLIGGNAYTYTRVDADPAIEAMLLDTEEEFWGRVTDRRPPPVDGSAASRELIRRLHPTAEPGTVVELDPAAARPWIETHRAAKADEADARSRAREAENHLTVMLADAEIGLVDGQQAVTWKNTHRDGYTVDPATYRRFHIPKGFS